MDHQALPNVFTQMVAQATSRKGSRDHYKRRSNYRELDQRLAEGSIKSGTCLLWTGKPNRDKYGLIKIDKRQYLVHRVAYALSADIPLLDLPVYLDIKHRCKNKNCIKPSHLYPAGRDQRGPKGPHADK